MPWLLIRQGISKHLIDHIRRNIPSIASEGFNYVTATLMLNRLPGEELITKGRTWEGTKEHYYNFIMLRMSGLNVCSAEPSQLEQCTLRTNNKIQISVNIVWWQEIKICSFVWIGGQPKKLFTQFRWTKKYTGAICMLPTEIIQIDVLWQINSLKRFVGYSDIFGYAGWSFRVLVQHDIDCMEISTQHDGILTGSSLYRPRYSLYPIFSMHQHCGLVTPYGGRNLGQHCLR